MAGKKTDADNKNVKTDAKKTASRQTDSGSSYSMAVRIGALVLAFLMVFGTVVLSIIQ